MDIHFLQELLKETGKIQLKYFGKKTEVALKENRDILHKADIESNNYLISELNKKYPSIYIISEETFNTHDLEHLNEAFIIDPLDGTINFSRGIKEFGISLAYVKNNQTQIGIVYKPAYSSLYVGKKNKGATLNGTPLQVSKTSSLKESVIALDTAREETNVPQFLPHLLNNIRGFRSFGCAVEALGYVAEGKIDAYLYSKTKIWDVAAMNLIIEEAGGYIANYKGTKWNVGDPIMATNPLLLKELTSIIS